MTEQQIKQNAQKYYDGSGTIYIESIEHPERNSIVEAYIAGAHSRDEEIKKLKNTIDKLKRENGQLKIDKEYWKESAMEYIDRDNEKY